jgi:hypothetical protein
MRKIWILAMVIGLFLAGTSVQAGDKVTSGVAVCLSVDSRAELATVTPETSPMYYYDAENDIVYEAIYVDIPDAVNAMGKSKDGINFIYLAGFDKSGKKKNDVRGSWTPGQMYVEFALTPKIFEKWNQDGLHYLRAPNGKGQDVWPHTWQESPCYTQRGGEAGYQPRYDPATHMFWSR